MTGTNRYYIEACFVEQTPLRSSGWLRKLRRSAVHYGITVDSVENIERIESTSSVRVCANIRARSHPDTEAWLRAFEQCYDFHVEEHVPMNGSVEEEFWMLEEAIQNGVEFPEGVTVGEAIEFLRNRNNRG